MKRRRFHTRPAAAPYVDRLLCPVCYRETVAGRFSWWHGGAVLECFPCDRRWSPAEYEAARDIALSGVKSPAGGGVA